MGKLIRDKELNKLVRELNQGAERQESSVESGDFATAPTMSGGIVPEGNALETLLTQIAERGASDMHLVADAPPIFRIDGALARSEHPPLTSDEVHSLFTPVLSSSVAQKLNAGDAVDFSMRLSGAATKDGKAWRFRVNLHKQRGTTAAAIRALPSQVPSIEELHLPASLAELMKAAHGLVLVCGPTGSGKSTTLAALVNELNKSDSRHVITIEDPIEYEHANNKSIIEQVEVGRDTPSFAAALRAALRQDPDVILVGEMRDLETVSTAITAAETGHLILSTMHTSDVAQAIHRIIDVFPPTQQAQIRQQLSLALNGIIVQHLIPRADGKGRAVAVEVIISNNAVRNHIRNDKLQNLTTEITLGKRQGMISLEDSLSSLVKMRLISDEDARARASRVDEYESLMRG